MPVISDERLVNGVVKPGKEWEMARIGQSGNRGEPGYGLGLCVT